MKANHTDVVAQENAPIVPTDVIDQDVRRAKEAHPKNADTANVHAKEADDHTMKAEVHTAMGDHGAVIAMRLVQVVPVIITTITTVRGN